jgi:hypothetical protein
VVRIKIAAPPPPPIPSVSTKATGRWRGVATLAESPSGAGPSGSGVCRRSVNAGG